MHTLNIKKSIVYTLDELREDLNSILLRKIPVDVLRIYPDTTGDAFEYADQFNYISFTMVPEFESVNIHVEFGAYHPEEYIPIGGAVLSWEHESMEINSIETMHLYGGAVPLNKFLEKMSEYLDLPRVGEE